MGPKQGAGDRRENGTGTGKIERFCPSMVKLGQTLQAAPIITLANKTSRPSKPRPFNIVRTLSGTDLGVNLF